jgi:hypothetical protein
MFMVAGIFFCLALIPTAVSSAATPAPLEDVALDLKGLYSTSPLALIGCFLTGVANGARGTRRTRHDLGGGPAAHAHKPTQPCEQESDRYPIFRS